MILFLDTSKECMIFLVFALRMVSTASGMNDFYSCSKNFTIFTHLVFELVL